MDTEREKLNRKGIALVIAMIFVAIFSSLGLAMLTMSGTNARVAGNHSQGNRAFESAMSGLETARYWLDGMDISSTTLNSIYSSMSTFLTLQGASNINLSQNIAHQQILAYGNGSINGTNDWIMLNTAESRGFKAVMTMSDQGDILYITVTGACGSITKTVQAGFNFPVRNNTVFDYGIATKGPLNVGGQAEIDGAADDPNTLLIDASVYIEGVDIIDGISFSITNNASIAGNVSISNDDEGNYSIGDKAVIGGIEGDENVSTGVPEVEFPVPNPELFKDLVAYDLIIPDDPNYDNHGIYNNVLIRADTGSVTFSSNVVINGLLYIEAGNDVHFAGKCTVRGIIACEGELEEDSGSLTFSGQVEAYDVGTLDDPEFADLDGDFGPLISEEGTFIVAPGFEIDFSGQIGDDMNAVNGAIAASGIKFSGQAGGYFNGSIINYSSDVMDLGGQSSLVFDRSGATKTPAGFGPQLELFYLNSLYSEAVF